MDTFYPSNPNDPHRTQAERRDCEEAIREKGMREKRDRVRFIITAILSGIAALAAVAGVLIQLASKQ